MKAQDFTFIVKNGSKQDGVKFVVEYPEFPGITGGNDNLLEAIQEAQEALQMFIDYRTKENRDIVERKSGRITLRVPSTMHFLCDEYSKLEGVSLNTFIIDAISEKIYSYKKAINTSVVFKTEGFFIASKNISKEFLNFEISYKGESHGKSSYVC